MPGTIITLVGGPATGKTYLCDKLAEYYPDSQVIYEEPAGGFPGWIKENFAKQKDLFKTLVWFRNYQVENYRKACCLREKGKIVILDTPFYQNQVYVKLYAQDEREKEILYKLGEIDQKTYPSPDCTIYIKSRPETVKAFLEKRKGANSWENKQWLDFITKIPPYVEEYITSIEIPNLITLNRAEVDFEKEKDFLDLVARIEKVIKK